MEEKTYFENILNITKLISDLLTHGSIESSHDNINKVFIKEANELLILQHNIYKEMEKKSWYKMEDVSEAQINKVCKKMQ